MSKPVAANNGSYVLCVGPNPAIDKFIWFDGFKKGAVNRIIRQQAYPGGKAVHVAYGVNELGGKVTLLSFWGGESGKWLKEQCENAGIQCHGPQIRASVRSCLTFQTHDSYNDTEILEPGPVIEEDELLEFQDHYKRLLSGAAAVCMSGSWPGGDVPATGYAQFIDLANRQQVPVFVDCSGKLLADALARQPYGVHINQHEGQELFGEKDPVILARLLAGHCRLAAVTCGARGLYLSNGQQVVHALCPVSRVISAVGSGDSLMAGLLTGFLQQDNLTDMAKLGAACGAANCMRQELGIFHASDVKKMYNQCKLSSINL